MKRLLLLRHAKSSRDEPALEDHQRPLNARGREDAPRMGAYMLRKKYLPQLVLCSTALRTVETLQLVREDWDIESKTEFLDSLYLPSAKAIAAIVQQAPDVVNALLIVSHNPGIEDCAAALTGQGETPAECETQDMMEEKFPTAALAVIDFDAMKWRDAREGRLVNFMRPKDLDD
ncbi:MAG TPA: histidine phosphatase family protein [Rhizomicrobium sp.]|nr:histidine phosphatase family protein [Rhizomicrobium sp.]